MINSQLRCKYDGHCAKGIIGVCINKECTKDRPYCHTCLKQFHIHHGDDLQDRDDFEIWIKERQDKNSEFLNQMTHVVEGIEFLKNKILNSKINYNSISQMTVEQINSIVKQMFNIKDIQEMLSNSLGQVNSILNETKETYKNLTNSLIENHEIQIQQQQISTFPIFRQAPAPASVSYQQKESFIEMSASIQPEDANMQQGNQNAMWEDRVTKNVIQVQIPNKFYFTEKYKNDKIIISKSGKKAKNDVVGGYCLCEPGVYWCDTSKLLFKIIELSNFGFIRIGICNKRSFQAINCNPELGNIGHGCYLIDNMGFTYSHINKNQNHVKQSFEFQVNDEILMEIGYSILTWWKLGSNESYSTQIMIDEDLNPCVGLYYSAIEIREYN